MNSASVFFGVVTATFVAVAVPVIIQGAPFMDDFVQCTAHENGLMTFLRQSFEDNGLVRPVRFAETLIINGGCNSLPFGFLIVLPLSFTIVAALLLAGLLHDLGVSDSWSKIGGALFLLYPVGAESALWPSAMHIPLGLALGIGSLRLFKRGSWLSGSVGFLLSALCIEQALFALPLAAWLFAPAAARRRSLLSTLWVGAGVLAAYVAFPGQQARTAVPIVDRFTAVFSEPSWYLRFPLNASGAKSMILAIGWSFPWLILFMGLAAAILGSLSWAQLGDAGPRNPGVRSVLLAGVTLIVLVNVPIIVTIPRDSSPRLFTPTWIVVAAVIAVLGSHITQRQQRLVGVCLGLFMSVAVTAMAFTAWARVNTADVTERAMRVIGEQVQTGDTVAVCDVPVSVVDPAPSGLYSQTELRVDWAASSALFHYTGVFVEFIEAQSDTDGQCGADTVLADLAVTFEELTVP